MSKLETCVSLNPAGNLLKSTFLKNRHRNTGDRFHSAFHDFTFQAIQLFMIPIGQFDKWNSLGNSDHTWQRKGAKTMKTKFRGWCIRSHMAPTLSAGIRQGMFDGINTPAFLIQHQIIQNTHDR